MWDNLKRLFWLSTGRDFPLAQDPATRMLPWIVGAMVYVMALSLMGVWALTQTASWWTTDLQKTVTVQAPALIPGQDENDYNAKLNSVVKIIRLDRDVASVTRVDVDEIRKNLEPFLGNSQNIDDLPLPVLFKVELVEGQRLDGAGLQFHLQKIMEGVLVDTHSTWQDKLLSIVSSLQIVSGLVVLAVFLTTLFVVIFATKAMMQSHDGIIQTLHLIGATDSYIARQFQMHALKVGLKGTFFGVIFALGTVWGVDNFTVITDDMRMGQMPEFEISQMMLIAIMSLIPLIGLMIARTAGKTVYTSLAEIFKTR